jgi:SlyX protein
MSGIDEQLADLQSRLAFLDDAVSEITRANLAQDQRIRQLEEEVKTLRQQLRASSGSPVADPGDETPPPHY